MLPGFGWAIVMRLLADTIRYSPPRTKTARPVLPVAITSPAANAFPRSPASVTPGRIMDTVPLDSDIDQDGGFAKAEVPLINTAHARALVKIFISQFPVGQIYPTQWVETKAVGVING